MKTLFISISLLLSLITSAQTLKVKSFQKLAGDQTARIYSPKEDQNGHKCAIIKVVTTETGFAWEAGSMGIVATEQKTGEYWLYIPYDSRRLTIKHAEFGNLENYSYPEPIDEATVYEMVLVAEKEIDASVKTGLLDVLTTPFDAHVFLNNEDKGITPLSLNRVEVGTYTLRIEKEGFSTITKNIEIKEGESFMVNEKLEKPNTLSDDRDGREYRTVTIGNQVWMAENLDYPVGKYVSGEYTWKDMTKTEVAWCYYNNKEGFRKNHGLLYSWEAANKACPEGWHLPTDSDWEDLAKYLQTQDSEIRFDGKKWINAGKYLKAGEENDLGFTGKMSGYRRSTGTFAANRLYGQWWSGTDAGGGYANYWELVYDKIDLTQSPNTKNYALSVRCIKNK